MKCLALTLALLLALALTACQAPPREQPEGIPLTVPIPRLDYVQENTNGPTFTPLEGYQP